MNYKFQFGKGTLHQKRMMPNVWNLIVRNDSETHVTVLLDCTTSEAGSATQ